MWREAPVAQSLPSVYRMAYMPPVHTDDALYRAKLEWFQVSTELVRLQIAQLIESSRPTEPPPGLYG